MSNDLDLDINNYSISDLVKFFKFNKHESLTQSSIELREIELRELLFSSGTIDKRNKQRLIEFLDSAKHLLINAKCPHKIADTPIPKPLDNSNFPVSLVNSPGRDQELNTRNVTNFVNSAPSEFFPGILNPLQTRVLNKFINIDTKFRDNLQHNPADFIVSLPQKIQKVVSIELASIELPLSFYNISQKLQTNSFNIVFGSTYHTITVSDGYYTLSTLIDAINALTETSYDILFSIDPHTNKIKASSNSSFSLDFGNYYERLGLILGFQQYQYLLDKHDYIAESFPDCDRFKYIYLAIDDYNHNSQNNFDSVFQKSLLSPHILSRLSLVNTSVFGVFTGNSTNMIHEPRKFFGPVDIQKLHIQIFDTFGKIIDLNGANYSLCLQFKTIYDL
jgi:hypothetical protein